MIGRVDQKRVDAALCDDFESEKAKEVSSQRQSAQPAKCTFLHQKSGSITAGLMLQVFPICFAASLIVVILVIASLSCTWSCTVMILSRLNLDGSFQCQIDFFFF